MARFRNDLATRHEIHQHTLSVMRVDSDPAAHRIALQPSTGLVLLCASLSTVGPKTFLPDLSNIGKGLGKLLNDSSAFLTIVIHEMGGNKIVDIALNLFRKCLSILYYLFMCFY